MNPEIVVEQDGNAWFAYREDLTNRGEHLYGVGATSDEAIKNLKICEGLK